MTKLDNINGVQKVQFVLPHEVSAFGSDSKKVYIILNGWGWHTLPDVHSVTITPSPVKSDSGMLYTIAGSFKIGGNLLNDSEYQLLRISRRAIFRFMLPDGGYVVAGTKQNPLVLKFSSLVSGNASDFNGILVSFSNTQEFDILRLG